MRYTEQEGGEGGGEGGGEVGEETDMDKTKLLNYISYHLIAIHFLLSISALFYVC